MIGNNVFGLFVALMVVAVVAILLVCACAGKRHVRQWCMTAIKCWLVFTAVAIGTIVVESNENETNANPVVVAENAEDNADANSVVVTEKVADDSVAIDNACGMEEAQNVFVPFCNAQE